MTTLTRDPFTPHALTKAQTLVGAVELADTPNTYYVPSGTDPGRFYRVTISHVGPQTRHVACTCPHGRSRVLDTQPVCAHATAALLHVLQARNEEA